MKALGLERVGAARMLLFDPQSGKILRYVGVCRASAIGTCLGQPWGHVREWLPPPSWQRAGGNHMLLDKRNLGGVGWDGGARCSFVKVARRTGCA